VIKINDKYQFSLNNISETAKQIIELDLNCRIFIFYGEMGSGKTTLIKEICKHLGSADNLSSPTFSIVNEYEYSNGKIFHFDLYRLKNSEELLDLGFEEYINSGNYCFIEWPKLAEPLLSNDTIKIELSTSENIRYLRASKF
jgi:tRNA threonylcarbamoyladenosine biosynthesis protein TsaE